MSAVNDPFPAALHTARLTLRAPVPTDAEWIFRTYAADVHAVRYLTWRPHQTVDDTREWLDLIAPSLRSGDNAAWVILRRSDGVGLGTFSARLVMPWHVEVGYVLGSTFWGHGYMTEALAAVRDAAFALGDVYRFSAHADVENVPSTRVMEKVGMRREGLLRSLLWHPNRGAEPRDGWCYAMTRDDHRALRA